MPHSVRSTGLPILARSRANSNSSPRIDILDVGAAIHVEGRVVAPFVRVADLQVDGGELGDRLLARGAGSSSRASTRSSRSAAIRLCTMREGLRLRLGRKIALHVILAEGFAELPVGRRHAAAPTRKNFLGAGECAAVEIEILVDEFLRAALAPRRESGASADRFSNRPAARRTSAASTALKKSGWPISSR